MNTNKHLDDLFAAARHEEPIISEENARELLAKSEHMQASPFIFSTKGIIMSTIGLGLAAFIGYLAFTSSPQAPVTHSTSVTMPISNLLAHSTNSNTDEPKKSDAKAAKKVIIATDANDDVVPIPPTPPLPPIPPLPSLPPMISTPVKVTGIKPIPLAPEKYAKLGIAKKDDGIVTFSQKNEHGKIFTMGFPKNSWGIIIGGKDLENAVSDAPHFAPLIVTDTKGNKRLMQFSSDKDGVKTRSMEIHAHGTNNDIDAEETSKIIDNAVNIENLQIGGEDGDVDKLTIGKLDSIQLKEIENAFVTDNPGANFNMDSLRVMIDTAPMSTLKTPGKKMQVQVYVNVDKRETDTSINGKSQKKIVVKNTIRIDSVMHAANEAVGKAHKELQKIVKKLHLENLSTSDVTVEKEMKELENEIANERGTSTNSIKHAHDAAMLAMNAMEKQYANLDKLVPILVRTATSEHVNTEEGITYDDGLIFWYNPEKELLAAVPEANKVQSSVATPSSDIQTSIISNAVIYPNPAKNKTTLRFALSEPRTVAFSIHDLLGKRVLDGGSIPETSAGSFEKELNVGELTEGVYLLVITTNKGEQNMQRLVIKK